MALLDRSARDQERERGLGRILRTAREVHENPRLGGAGCAGSALRLMAAMTKTHAMGNDGLHAGLAMASACSRLRSI